MNTEGTQPEANWFLAQYYGEESQKRKQLQLLKDEKKRLNDRINARGTQDGNAMRERDEIVGYITALEKEIQERYGSSGGRRKKHRRTHRRSKSRVKKSGAKKSRRSKH